MTPNQGDSLERGKRISPRVEDHSVGNVFGGPTELEHQPNKKMPAWNGYSSRQSPHAGKEIRFGDRSINEPSSPFF